MKLKDITNSPAKAFKILTEIGSPGMMESLEKIKEIATTIQEIEDSLKDPPMLKNIENMNLSSEAMQNAAVNIRTIRSELDATGIIEEARITSALSKEIQNLTDLTTSFKDIARSVKQLMDELKLDSHKSA
ncbi:MAG TPA: hypothetical protein VEP90_18560 [Methylomirabilota bacterium]|nr:hypothetical protein [Methylomirabilota bacterium]